MVEYVSISAWVNAQKGKQDTVVRKIVLDIDADLSRRSPVDTGAFKANWMMGIDYQPTGYDLEKKDSKRLGVKGDTVGDHASLLPRLHAAGKVYYLVNNLPYANALERGHSAQAPSGVVGLTLIDFNGIVETNMTKANSNLGFD